MFKKDKLSLKGSELLVCAYLFACRDRRKEYQRRVTEITQALNFDSRRTITVACNSLVKKKILIRSFRKYRTNQKTPYYHFNQDFVFDKVFNNPLKS